MVGSFSSSLALLGWRGPGKIEVILSVWFSSFRDAIYCVSFSFWR